MKWLPSLVARIPAGLHIKLLGAFLLVVGLLFGIGAAGLQTLDGVNRRAEELSGLQRKAAAYRQLQHHTTWQLYSLAETLLSRDDRRLDSVLRQLDQFRYDLDRVQFVTDGEKVLFRKIQEAHAGLIEVITKVVELARTGSLEQGMAFKLSRVMPVSERLERLVNEMLNRTEADMVDRVHAGQEAYRVSRLLIISFALVSIGIAILLGYAISGSIIGPAKEMDEHLSKIASGEFTKHIRIPNKDEMGTLAANLNHMNDELGRLYGVLESRNRYIRETFGRYLSNEVVEDILETPDGLKLGGEKRDVAVMMTDLRGFTALTERLRPEEVVTMLNLYFEVMVEVIQQYRGTIDEIIGDALVVLFGSLHAIEGREETAVACAIAMQNAMVKVNAGCHALGLPGLEMGIGIDDGPLIVGNIGSSQRLKYTVIGRSINTASRIESYTVGGEILVSDTIRKEVGNTLMVAETREIFAKGSELPIRIYSVVGISGIHNLALEGKEREPESLPRPVPLVYSILDGKQVGGMVFNASVIRLSRREADIIAAEPLDLLSNLKMNLKGVYEELAIKGFYAKVMAQSEAGGECYRIRFTSAPPEVIAYLQAHRDLQG